VFRAAGHGATDVRDIGLGTAPDSAIAAHAKANQMALVTADLDFANIIAYGIALDSRCSNAPRNRRQNSARKRTLRGVQEVLSGSF
jgi:predicted nuclease of predicted toxin-antitoxin system